MGAQWPFFEGDAALLDQGAYLGGEQVQSLEVAADPAPQHPFVEVPGAAQCQWQGTALRGEVRERRPQEGDGADRELPEERQGDVPVLDAVPPHARVRGVGGAQFPLQFVLRVVGRGEGDEHADGRGPDLLVPGGGRTGRPECLRHLPFRMCRCSGCTEIRSDPMRCGAIRCGAMHTAVRCGAPRGCDACIAVRCASHCGAMCCGAPGFGPRTAVPCGTRRAPPRPGVRRVPRTRRAPPSPGARRAGEPAVPGSRPAGAWASSCRPAPCTPFRTPRRRPG